MQHPSIMPDCEPWFWPSYCIFSLRLIRPLWLWSVYS